MSPYASVEDRRRAARESAERRRRARGVPPLNRHSHACIDCGGYRAAAGEGRCWPCDLEHRREGVRRTDAALRFWPQVDMNGPVPTLRPDLGQCWVWTGFTYQGWGRFTTEPKSATRRGAKSVGAHRFAYESEVGPIPRGLEIDHLCFTRSCVRPSHLEPVTGAENKRRMNALRERRTHCRRGHEYATNARWYATTTTGHGGWQCRPCMAESRRNRRVAA